jgi:hypothetical protein
MIKSLSRRGFLKLCGTSSIGLALAACGIAPSPTTTPPSKTRREVGEKHGIVIATDYSRDNKAILGQLPERIKANFNGLMSWDVRPVQLWRARTSGETNNGWAYAERAIRDASRAGVPQIWYYLAEPGRFQDLTTLDSFRDHVSRTLDLIKISQQPVFLNGMNEPGDGGDDPIQNPLLTWFGKDWLYQLYLLVDELASSKGLRNGKDFYLYTCLIMYPWKDTTITYWKPMSNWGLGM